MTVHGRHDPSIVLVRSDPRDVVAAIRRSWATRGVWLETMTWRQDIGEP